MVDTKEYFKPYKINAINNQDRITVREFGIFTAFQIVTVGRCEIKYTIKSFMKNNREVIVVKTFPCS